MTREDKLYSMKMVDLAAVAEKLGIKINKKAAKSEAIEKILAAEEMNKKNDKEIAKEEKQTKKIFAEIEKPVAPAKKLVPMPGTEDPNWGEKHFANNEMIDPSVMSKFVKKAQKMITQAIHDSTGYHVTINVNGKEAFYHDKNLQNIRAALGHIYRGEAEV